MEEDTKDMLFMKQDEEEEDNSLMSDVETARHAATASQNPISAEAMDQSMQEPEDEVELVRERLELELANATVLRTSLETFAANLTASKDNIAVPLVIYQSFKCV